MKTKMNNRVEEVTLAVPMQPAVWEKSRWY